MRNATTWAVTTDAYAFQNGHQGGKIDSVSGKLYFRNRIYDVDSMRWMQEDPLLYVDGTNLYLYVGANPLGGVDPWGFRAPEFDGEVLMMCVLDRQRIAIYRDLAKNGKPWTRIATLTLPANSMEPI